MTAGIVIIGGGQAASSAAAKLRELDAEIPITMICGEPVLPYQRPPLSKAYLAGEMPLDRLVLRPQEWFEDAKVNAILGVRAQKVDPATKSVKLDDERSISYDKLLLATGSVARRLPEAVGGDLDGVYYLRSTSDADAMQSILKADDELVVVGGGYIGLEVAAVAAKHGMTVTVVEMADRILQRVASQETSDYFRALHATHGVKILEGVGLSSIDSENGNAVAVQLTDESALKADAILVGIGILPETELAIAAGLELENGICVDDQCRTSDADIYAAGDCASFDFHGDRIRLESVPNAIHQAEVASVNMLGGAETYLATPWFWSDQYDVKLQIAGLCTGFDSTVVRPGRRPGAQSVWYYQGDQLIAVDAMSDAPAFMIGRRIIEAGKALPKEVAADPSANLKDWA